MSVSLVKCVDVSVLYKDGCSKLKQLQDSDSADVPKNLRSLRVAFEACRQFINGLKNAEFTTL